MTALIVAVTSLVGAVAALWHSVQTRKQIPPKQ
jgi:hypothetical protein